MPIKYRSEKWGFCDEIIVIYVIDLKIQGGPNIMLGLFMPLLLF
jgi:hypothetical protein